VALTQVPLTLSPRRQVLQPSYLRSSSGNHAGSAKPISPPPVSFSWYCSHWECSTSLAWLGKGQKGRTTHNAIEMTKAESCRGKVMFQRPSTVHCTESSFCSPSEPRLNVISAVSLLLSRDDGSWQDGDPWESYSRQERSWRTAAPLSAGK